MPWFRKHHACPCSTDWWDEWDCLCNDRCPTCEAEIEPDEHEAIQGAKSAKSAYAFSDRPALDPSPRFPQLLGRRPAEIAARKKAALDAGLTPAS